MTNISAKGKVAALEALANRRELFKDLKLPNNASLYAGEPMYFHCQGCRAQIVVPESYITKPDLCAECQALVILGWME